MNDRGGQVGSAGGERVVRGDVHVLGVDVVVVGGVAVVKSREWIGSHNWLIQGSDSSCNRSWRGDNNRVVVESAGQRGMDHRLGLLRQVISGRAISVFVGDIIHRVCPAIRSNVRIRALDDILVRRLDTLLRPANSVGGLVAGGVE